MTSEVKIQSNRLNAKRSTGPRTDRGKKRSSVNALKHGLTARTDVIPGDPYRSYRVGGTDKIVVRANRPLCTCKGEVSPLSGDNRHLEVSPLSGDNRHLEVSLLSGDNRHLEVSLLSGDTVCEQEGSHCREFSPAPVLAPNASAQPPLHSPHVKRFADSARSYKSFRRQLLLELSPQSFLDHELADRVIGDLWRLKRIPKLESAIMREMRHKEPSVPPALAELAIALDHKRANLTDTYDSPEVSPSSTQNGCHPQTGFGGAQKTRRYKPVSSTGWLDYSEHFSRFSRYESSLERSLFRSLNEFRRAKSSMGGMDQPTTSHLRRGGVAAVRRQLACPGELVSQEGLSQTICSRCHHPSKFTPNVFSLKIHRKFRPKIAPPSHPIRFLQLQSPQSLPSPIIPQQIGFVS